MHSFIKKKKKKKKKQNILHGVRCIGIRTRIRDFNKVLYIHVDRVVRTYTHTYSHHYI